MTKEKYNAYKNLIEKNLKEIFEEYSKNSSYSKTLWESMSYTTLLSAKRLRAIISLEFGKLLGAKEEELLPNACALEIMQAYSLIHDDLPSMDNDDLRRGKPSNHKVFGEAIATLAGDALISFGAQIIIDKTPKTIEPKIVLDIVNDYLKTAGALGIVAGQVADIEAENKVIDIENLKYIHKYKTGALYKCSILTAAKIAKAKKETLEKLEEYADNFGILFQIYDDIIDGLLTSEELGKTAGKDEKNCKSTYVTIYGLEEAKKIFYSLIDKNHGILSELGLKSDILEDIYNLLIEKVEK